MDSKNAELRRLALELAIKKSEAELGAGIFAGRRINELELADRYYAWLTGEQKQEQQIPPAVQREYGLKPKPKKPADSQPEGDKVVWRE